MSLSRPPKSVRKRREQARASLHERLQLPVVSSDKLKKLRSPGRRSKTIGELVVEIETFGAASEAVRRSHKYYTSALKKVYEVWVELLILADVQRDALIATLNERNPQVTKRGSALHVLLRSLIDYCVADPAVTSDEAKRMRQAAAVRLSRDVAVLHHAQRLDVGVDDFAAFVAQMPGGLDQIAKSEAQARKAERAERAGSAPSSSERKECAGPAEPKRPTSSRAIRSESSSPASSLREPEGGDASLKKARSRWKLGKALRRKLSSPTLENREVIVRVFIGGDGQRVVRDAYQLSKPYISDDEFQRRMEGIEARLVGKGRKRPKV